MNLGLLYTLLFGACYLQVPSLNQAHVSFELSHLGVLNVEGGFDKITGEFHQEGEVWMINGHIDVKSINTGNNSRDETVLTEQYLNAEVYPNIPFQAELNLTKGTLAVEAAIRGLPLKFETRLRKIDDELVSDLVVIDREEIGLDFGTMDTLIGDEITFVIHSGINL